MKLLLRVLILACVVAGAHFLLATAHPSYLIIHWALCLVVGLSAISHLRK